MRYFTFVLGVVLACYAVASVITVGLSWGAGFSGAVAAACIGLAYVSEPKPEPVPDAEPYPYRADVYERALEGARRAVIITYGGEENITPDQIRRDLSDREAWLWVGKVRLAVPVSPSASDDSITVALIAVERLSQELNFMAGDLRGVLDKRAAERVDAENEAHEQHAEQPVATCGDHHMAEFWMNDAGTVLCAICDGLPPGMSAAADDQPAPDVLVAGDALADDAEVPCPEVDLVEHVPHAWMSNRTMHWCPGWAAPDLGEKEGAFERYESITTAEHKRAREAGEDR